MAAGRKSKARIGIAIHHGKIRPRAQIGWIDADNFTAVVIIAIILAARLIVALAKLAWITIRLLVRLSWPVAVLIARWARHRLTGIVLAMRAFYPL